MNLAARVWKEFLNLLYPPKCILCTRLLEDRSQWLCDPCQKRYASRRPTVRIGESFSDCISPLEYVDDVRSSIHRYKFQHNSSYAAGYASIMAEALRWTPQEECDLITWAPVSRKRLRKRGYDQSELLAKALAELLGIPAVPMLEKVRNNPAQSSLAGANSRWTNVRGIYRIRDGADPKGKKILLVDDIITTGATISECCRVLSEAGAEAIYCTTVAAAV